MSVTIALTYQFGSASLLYPYLSNLYPDTLCMAIGPSTKFPEKYGLASIKIEELKLLPNNADYKIFLGASSDNYFNQIQPILMSLGHLKLEKILVIDSWVNYRDRYLDGSPDTVLVFDDFAHSHASSMFQSSETKIQLAKNYYLEECQLRLKEKITSTEHVVFIEGAFNSYTHYGKITDEGFCICEKLESLIYIYPDKEIVYRYHPSGKGPSCLEKVRSLSLNHFNAFRISTNPDLIDDLAGAISVIGLPSYALYISQEMGYKTYLIENTNENWHGPSFPVLTL